MAKDYTKSAQTALKLIKEFGLPGFFIRNEGIVSDNSKQWEGKENTEISYPANIVVLPLTSVLSRDNKLMSDSIATETTSIAFMDAVEFTEIPTVGDFISHDDVRWEIVSIDPLKPANVNILWQMLVKI